MVLYPIADWWQALWTGLVEIAAMQIVMTLVQEIWMVQNNNLVWEY